MVFYLLDAFRIISTTVPNTSENYGDTPYAILTP